ncbi:MAG: sulfatase-like hydrolase/transferase [Planctomycetota bacterium]|nr:sulfatase-like hydrolase/transferase [Planctomycetota bacterium]
MHLESCVRRTAVLYLVSLSLAALITSPGPANSAEGDKPNFVVIFTDDQGYGDLGCYGSETIRTPRIDRLAAEGTRFTSFYAQVVCGPSRSALLTGRYPVRSLGWSMPASEITLAERLQAVGYTTGCIGKWDVSNRQAILDRMPHAQGFDYYYGTLGANDNGRVVLHENNERVGSTDDMASLTRIYTDKGIEFLKRHRQGPFFLYLAHTMVHSVIDASDEFKGRSKGGLYGDTVEELDHHTGRLLDAVDELGLRENTLVIFTSDNGPWNNLQENLRKKHNGQIAWGSSGPLREGKGSTYEGGLRVPCIVRWPGHVPSGRTSDAIFATIDFLPTFGKLAGYDLPSDRIIDGVDQTDLLLGKSEAGARDDYFYFCKGELHAVRRGPWKLLLPDRKKFYVYVKDKGSPHAELYNLERDLGESSDQADARPEIVKKLLAHARALPLPDAPYDDRIRLNRPRSRSPAKRTSALPRGDWSRHGFTAAQRQRIRSAFQAGIDEKFIPGGALTLIHKGEVILSQAFGVADLETRRPFLTSSPCRIASLTKPHTATLLMKLAAEGKVSLDAPVDTYLPEFKGIEVRGKGKAKQAPTLLQCLSHTAGFPGNNALKAGKFSVELDGDLSDVITDLATKELLAEPGTRHAYSRLGYMTAGRVAEVVTGRPFAELMQTLLLEPLGAGIATFTPSAEMLARMPAPYDRTRTGFRPREGTRLGTALNPGGSLVSTLDDVARLLLMHRNQGRIGTQQFIPAEMLTKMYDPQPSTPGAGYGLGFNIMQRRDDGTAARIRHTGASGTLGVIDFERDLIIIVLTQVPQRQTNRWRNRLLQTINNIFPRR